MSYAKAGGAKLPGAWEKFLEVQGMPSEPLRRAVQVWRLLMVNSFEWRSGLWDGERRFILWFTAREHKSSASCRWYGVWHSEEKS